MHLSKNAIFGSHIMKSLLIKEIRTFLTSLTGIVSIVVFLILTSLFLWIIPGDMNILRNGFSNIDPLFNMAPWVFLFLVPAITMRSFAEEKRSGTIELLLTQPLTDLQIVLSKYIAGLLLVLFSLLPTLLFYFTVHKLGNPAGNIDTGGMWGSYIGLLFLGSAFIAIGTFASSLSDNQVIAFILSLFLCFICYTGFEFISSLKLFENIDHIIINLGINEHYLSMSRGVIDTRDILYFLSIDILFILASRTVLESRKW